MSTYYDVFIEIKKPDGWEGINFYRKGADGKFQIVPIVNGMSMLGMIIDFSGENWPVSNISDELKAVYSTEDFNWYQWDIKSILTNGNLMQPEFSGFIPKQMKYDFEAKDTYEIPEDQLLTPEEFKDLDPVTKEAYVYYEWTPAYGSRSVMREVLAGVNARIDAYNEEHYTDEATLENTRLVYVIS